MIKLIAFLISGCWHEWQVYTYARFEDTYTRGTNYHLRCKKCGNMKFRRSS